MIIISSCFQFQRRSVMWGIRNLIECDVYCTWTVVNPFDSSSFSVPWIISPIRPAINAVLGVMRPFHHSITNTRTRLTITDRPALTHLTKQNEY